MVDLLQIRSSCEALPTLTRSIYNELAACSTSFGMNISVPMFEYYTAVLVYYRLMLIDKKEGRTLQEEDQTLHLLEDAMLHIPAPLAVWLDGLGQIETTDQGRIAFLTYVRRNLQGHFGQIDEANHTIYETQPCMYVLTERFRREVDAYVQHGELREWNLPALMLNNFGDHTPVLTSLVTQS